MTDREQYTPGPANVALQLTAANPLVWAVLMALLAAVVAYGRYGIGPSTSA